MSAPSIFEKLPRLRDQEFRLTDRARLEWMLQGTRIAVQAEDWESAYRRLREFAEFVEFSQLDAWARAQIIFGLVESGAHADAAELSHDLQSLPATEDVAPGDAVHLGARLFEIERPFHAMMLGEALAERFPDDGYGHYLLARSYEAAIRVPRYVEAAFERMRTSPLVLYRRAAELFESHKRTGLARDATVSMVQLAYENHEADDLSRSAARQLAGTIDRPDLVSLIAPALARSSMFTDRFRALDIFEDVGEGLRLGKPGFQVSTTAYREALRSALEGLPDQRRDDEDERWSDLISTWFDDAEAARRRQELDALLYEAMELSEHDPEALAREIRQSGFGGLRRPYIDLWTKLGELDREGRQAWQPAIVAWVPRAEAPSFGFGQFGATLHQWKLVDAARAATHRSALDDEELDDEVSAFLAVRNLSSALKTAGDRRLLENLDRLHDLDQPNGEGK